MQHRKILFVFGVAFGLFAASNNPASFTAFAQIGTGGETGTSQSGLAESIPSRAAMALIRKEQLEDSGTPVPPLSFELEAAGTALDKPYISSIEVKGNEITVIVTVPAGIKKVTLESKTRLGKGAWVPRAVKHANNEEEITFTLNLDSSTEVLRVRANPEDELPVEFFGGDSEFNGQASYYDPSPGDDRFLGPPEAAVDPNADGANSDNSREVVESDIWKIQDNTLYFFNQYRGLQIINIGDPDRPIITGALDLPAVGEQMYVMPDGTVILLARSGCGGGNDAMSEVMLVKVVDGQPEVLHSLPVPGSILESRMVGTALYVASRAYQLKTVEDRLIGEWGTHVNSFDLADPSSPVKRDSLTYPETGGYTHTVMATQEYLFVSIPSTTSWRGPAAVHCIDISAPDGTMVEKSTITPAGRVVDKFKMNQSGDIFTVISEVWSDTLPNRLVTKLENFSLSDPTRPEKIGEVEVGHGEQLFASRFAEDRVYIVTFQRVDPLWIVDNSDPEHPAVSGELQIPGYSTYIQPVGDKLVTIGIDNLDGWRAAVQLFDVADPKNPSLLSKIPLGDNYSWTEANYDEKAFSVLPDAGLILVPFQGYSENGYASRVQIIDLEENSLTKRGVIDHAIPPRRATLFNERILSISGRELIVVDAEDRDNPQVTAELTLSWSVDRVLTHGDFLVELSGVNTWQNNYSAVLRVVSMDDPQTVLDTMELDNELPVLGVDIHEGLLYVLQGKQDGVFWYGPAPEGDATEDPAPEPEENITLSIFDLSAMPDLSLVSSISFTTEALGWSSGFRALWTTEGTLVWTGGGNNYRYAVLDFAVAPGMFAPWPQWGGDGRLIAFDVSQKEAPKLVSDVNLTNDNLQWWSFSKARIVGDLVYLSHQGSEFIEGATIPGQTPPTIYQETDPNNPDGATDREPVKEGVWVQKYYLDVVDYTDPTTPTIRKPVEIPGTLIGVSSNGAIVYTQGYHWDENWQQDVNEWLDASAYDGVEIHLVDSLALPNRWMHPVQVSKDAIFIGDPAITDDASPDLSKPSTLDTYVLSDTGELEMAASLTLDSPADYFFRFGDLFVVQQNDRQLLLFDSRDSLDLVEIGSGIPAQCWVDPTVAETVADGTLERGLWIPLHDYGVENIPTGSTAE